MDLSNYDQAGEGLTELVKKQPGFIIHVAYKTPDGVGVQVTYGRSREQSEKFFNENVKPNVPFEIKREVIELHNLVQP